MVSLHARIIAHVNLIYAQFLSVCGGITTIDGTSFIGNSAGQGGAINQYHFRTTTPQKNLTDTLIIKNSSFTDNKANAAGAVSILRDVTITSTSFIGNTVIGETDGGGALFLGAESNVVISDSLFDGNISKTSTGGAIATRQGDRGDNKDAKLEIVNTTFTNNTALADYLDPLTEEQKSEYAGRGGALQNAFYGSKSDPERVTITGSTFEANKALYGGAILNEYKGSVADRVTKTAKISIANSNFKANVANEDGGAIYNNGGNITVRGSTSFTENTAKRGGAIYSDSDVTLDATRV